METFNLVTVALTIFIVVFTLLLILIPFHINRIRNESIKTNKLLAKTLEKLDIIIENKKHIVDIKQ